MFKLYLFACVTIVFIQQFVSQFNQWAIFRLLNAFGQYASGNWPDLITMATEIIDESEPGYTDQVMIAAVQMKHYAYLQVSHISM